MTDISGTPADDKAEHHLRVAVFCVAQIRHHQLYKRSTVTLQEINRLRDESLCDQAKRRANPKLARLFISKTKT